MQIYGELTPDLIQVIADAGQNESADESVTIREPVTGFDRLPPR